MQSVSKLSIVSYLVAATLSSAIAQAGGPVCGTQKECNELKSKVEARIKELTTVPNLTDIVRNPDGSVWTMNQYDAEKYCKDQGLRLPTVRELALYSQSLGARGLRETAYAGKDRSDAAVQTEISQMTKDNYYAIYTKNSAGQTAVDFYFNHSGYKPPTGDLGNYWFWSSSVYPEVSNFAYFLYGDLGDFSFVNCNNDYALAVRCAR